MKELEIKINNELKIVDPKLTLKDIPNEIKNLPNKIETKINTELKKVDPKLTLKDIPKEIKPGFEKKNYKPFTKNIK